MRLFLVLLALCIACFSFGYAIENNNDDSKLIVLQKLKRMMKPEVADFHQKNAKNSLKNYYDIKSKLQRKHLTGQLIKSKLSRFLESETKK